MFWASKYVGVGPAWMRDANGVMTSRMLVGRGPLVRAEQQLRDHEILEVNQRGMGAPGADPFFHVIAGGVRAGAQTVVYLDTLRTSESGSASWSVMSGNLPPGIALASNGVLSGTPTSTGTFDFIAKAAAGSRAGFGRFSITVTAVPAVVVSLPDVVAALLGGPAVSNAVAEYLDQQGNKNGKLDVGDLRAYLRAQGKLGGVSTP